MVSDTLNYLKLSNLGELAQHSRELAEILNICANLHFHVRLPQLHAPELQAACIRVVDDVACPRISIPRLSDAAWVDYELPFIKRYGIFQGCLNQVRSLVGLVEDAWNMCVPHQADLIPEEVETLQGRFYGHQILPCGIPGAAVY